MAVGTGTRTRAHTIRPYPQLAMKAVLDFISRYQLGLVLLALVAGFIIPEFFAPLNPLNSFFLMVIMFATGIRLDYAALLMQVKDWRTLLLAVSMMMVIMPFLITIPLKFFAPDWTLPFILAAAMPTGLTAPAVMAIMGGRTSLALLISVSTSVVAPFVVPIMLNVLIGETVAIDTVSMMTNISVVVIVPLLLAGIVQWKAGKKRIQKADAAIRMGNLAAFALVIASVTASSASSGAQTGAAWLGIGADGIIIVFLMIVFWFGIAWLAASLLAWRDKLDRLTIIFCLMYMNTTLGVWLADRFFRDTGIAPKLVAIFVATTIILPLFKLYIPAEKRRGYARIYAVEQT